MSSTGHIQDGNAAVHQVLYWDIPEICDGGSYARTIDTSLYFTSSDSEATACRANEGRTTGTDEAIRLVIK